MWSVEIAKQLLNHSNTQTTKNGTKGLENMSSYISTNFLPYKGFELNRKMLRVGGDNRC